MAKSLRKYSVGDVSGKNHHISKLECYKLQINRICKLVDLCMCEHIRRIRPTPSIRTPNGL